VHDEEWLDQIGRGEVVFPDETAKRVSPAAASGSYYGSGGHGGKTRERRLEPQPRRSTVELGTAVAGFYRVRLRLCSSFCLAFCLRSPDPQRV
jgi:hypothetical protein